jgi:hypothetical protein
MSTTISRPQFRNRQQTRSVDGLLSQVIDRTVSSGFDPDFFAAMNERDDELIRQEVLNGAGSSKYVYSFKLAGSQVTGISVIGARELAAKYGGIKHRLVSSVFKDGTLMVVEQYDPMDVRVTNNEALASIPDYYKVVIEMVDLKNQNTVMVEKREAVREKRSAGTRQQDPSLSEYYDRPHYDTIARSKAYRDAVLSLIPQNVIIEWKEEMLKLNKGDVLTANVLEEKRSAVVRFATAKAIPVDRQAVAALTMEQIAGLSDAAREGNLAQFNAAAHALGILLAVEGPASGTTAPAKQQQKPATQEKAAGQGKPAQPAAQQEKPVEGASTGQASGSQEQPGAAWDSQGFEYEALDEVGEPINAGSQDDPDAILIFTTPLLFAQWLEDYMARSSNPRGVWENNTVAREAALTDDKARAVLETIVLPPETSGEQQGATEQQQESHEQNPPQQETRPDKEMLFARDLEAEFDSVKTSHDLEQIIRRETTKAWSRRIREAGNRADVIKVVDDAYTRAHDRVNKPKPHGDGRP